MYRDIDLSPNSYWGNFYIGNFLKFTQNLFHELNKSFTPKFLYIHLFAFLRLFIFGSFTRYLLPAMYLIRNDVHRI